MMWWLITYFVVGAFQDILINIDFKLTQHTHPFWASAVSTFSGWLNLVVFGSILMNIGAFNFVGLTMDMQIEFLINISVYCFGGFVGSFSSLIYCAKKGW